MSTCIKCRSELPEGAAFCPSCGKRQAPAPRKHRKRSNGTGCISKLSGNRAKPWMARKNDVCIGTFSTRHDAQKALERLTDVTVNDKFNMTFAQVYERWHEEHKRKISDSMDKNYQLAYKQCSQLHDMQMRKILRSDYQACVIALEMQGKSKSSCNKVRVLLGQLGRWAMEEGITLTNPAEDLNTVAKQKTTREIFTEEDIKAIKQSTLHAADIALILISCGCRPGELFSVPLVNCREDHFIGGSKTDAGKNRVIPIGPDGIAAYQKIRNHAIKKGCPLLIEGYEGQNKTAPNFTKREWRDLMEEIGRQGMTPYSCRHTFITRAIRSGVELPVLEAIVGHVDRETTKIYTHLHADDLVEAVQAIKDKSLAVRNKSVTRSENPKERIKKSS
ncbi:MAG: tyrosine-type recombinase/integrase [Oscillospiraceae bacterium]|nr:tyrosine-type recombinase/integrase [Oscillospiraceae bacterium]MBR2422043.1 tyrosine-type recombinase/integrase [Oscillospiraceae bacterium]